MHPTHDEIVWAAGFIDGEGCVTTTLSKRWGVYCLALTVGQTTRAPLRTLQLLFGGGIHGPYKKDKPHHNQKWTWALGGKGAKEALGMMWPYLRVKERQATIALAFPIGGKRDVRSRNLRDALREKCNTALKAANGGPACL